MSVFSYLKSLYQRISDAGDLVFSYPVSAQKRYLNSQGKPEDDIERGYYQYKCQMKLLGPLRAFLFSAASFVLFIFFYCVARHKRTQTCVGVKAVYFGSAAPGFIPPGILGEYRDLLQIKTEPGMSLDGDDAAFIRSIIRQHPFSWYFIYKCMLKTAMYGGIIRSFSPEALIVSNESSFTSSVLTAYCERLGIRHINFMHGEKLFTIRDSFFRFHKCYIWDEYYRRLFVSLRAEPEQFVVEAPPAMMPRGKPGSVNTVDFTYYLQNQKGRVLLAISESLKKLKSRGYTVAVRPHPIYSNEASVNALFGGLIIENGNEISIEQSIAGTRHAVSLYSTVLQQALNSGAPVVIDDISDAAKFKKLSELEFYSLRTEHTLLSEVMSECRGTAQAPFDDKL